MERHNLYGPKIVRDKGTLVLDAELNVASLHPEKFYLCADDCLDELQLNGSPIPDLKLPYCNYSRCVEQTLGPLLHGGSNAFHAKVRNRGGRFGFSIVP